MLMAFSGSKFTVRKEWLPSLASVQSPFKELLGETVRLTDTDHRLMTCN